MMKGKVKCFQPFLLTFDRATRVQCGSHVCMHKSIIHEFYLWIQTFKILTHHLRIMCIKCVLSDSE